MVSLLLHYIQLEEDLNRFQGSTKLGEDYIAGATLMLRLSRGSICTSLASSGICRHRLARLSSVVQVHSMESSEMRQSPRKPLLRWIDARYRLGNFSLDPSFLYLLGTRKFCTPGSLINTAGEVIRCTSAPLGSKDIQFNAFEAQVVAQYTAGSWLGAGKFAYTSGNGANDDINNRGLGKKSDVKGFARSESMAITSSATG